MSEFQATSAAEQLRQGRIASVRRVLSWLEDNPDYPLPYEFQSDFTHYVSGDADSQKADLAAFAFTFGTCEKVSPGTDSFGLRKGFGELGLRVLFSKAKTCTAKVIGKKIVREPVYEPVRYVEREVDEIEYECPASVLKNRSVT